MEGDNEFVEECSYNCMPEIGMAFDSEDSAYEFYNTYARSVGFSIRRSDAHKSNGILRKRKFCCSKEGFKGVDKRKALQPQPETRTGCEAHMVIIYQSSGSYLVSKFEENHNHDLVPTPLRHNLRSHRKIGKAQAAQVDIIDGSGLAPKTVIDLMSGQVGGRRNLGFVLNDVKSYLRTKRETRMENGIAGALIQYFKNKQKQNPSFFHSMQLDTDEQITNVFWADARSIVDYAHYGDVVCFDTTYRTNNHGRPFAPFVGVNNHRQTIIFGGALLYDETADSFIWLFETFLEAMSGRRPKTILTDQSAAMAKAISIVLPDTRHRLCIWHLTQNATKHLGHLYATEGFRDDFYACIYGYETEDEFLDAWKVMLEKYNLEGNKWLQQTFAEKEKWALVYGRDTFCADMKSTQRSESLNALLRRYLNSKHDPLRFFQHFDRVMDDRRESELNADFKMMDTIPVIPFHAPMVSCVASVYTPEILELFQAEYGKSLSCSIYIHGEVGHMIQYKVHRYRGSERTVFYNLSTDMVTCSCKKFEFMGIQCCHVLKVLDHRNIKELPQLYILKRWTRDAKSGVVLDSCSSSVQVDPISELGRRFQELSHGLIQVASKAAETHHSTNLVKRRTNEMMREVEEDLRKSSTTFEDDNVQDDEGEDPSNNEVAKGFKRRGKKTVGGKPQKRWIGGMERRSRGQSSQTQHEPHIASHSVPLFQPMVGNYDNSEGMHSMTQLLQAQESLFYPTQMSQSSQNLSEEWRRNTDY